MNTVRNKVLNGIEPYVELSEHKDLIAFTVGADYFNYDCKSYTELDADFNEIIVVVEKDWLFKYMKKFEIKNPLEYLRNEYTWDDSSDWFEAAKVAGKIVTVEFN